MIREAVATGVRACKRSYTAAVWTYVLGTLASMPIAIAVAVIAGTHASWSELAGEFAGGLDPLLWLQILRQEQGAAAVVIAAAAGLLGFWTFMSTYLAAATIGAVSRAERTTTSEFFAGGGRAIGRLLRLLLFTVPFFGLTVVLPGWGMSMAVEAITKAMISERGVLAVRAAAIAIAMLLFAWSSTAHDFMRVEAVARGEHRARYAFWRGIERAARHPFAAVALTALFGGGALMITVLASLVDARLSRSSWVLIAVGIVLQQSIVLTRAMLRIALAGAEVGFVMSTGARR